MSLLSRRKFIKNALAGLGAASLGNVSLPGVSFAAGEGIRALVVVQLMGGLDPWLAFPYTANETDVASLRGDYARIPATGLLQIAPGLGVHPGLRALTQSYASTLKVVMQTGNAFNLGPDGSHDVASLLMMTGGFGGLNNRYGWTARLYDAGVQLEGFGGHAATYSCQSCSIPPFRTTTYEDFDISKTAFGERQGGLINSRHVEKTMRALNSITPNREVSDVEKRFRAAQTGMFKAEDDLRTTLNALYQTSRFTQYTAVPPIVSNTNYQGTHLLFGQRFRNIAQKLKYMKLTGLSGDVIFVISLGGFDLHGSSKLEYSWRYVGDRLMEILGSTLKTFRDDLVAEGLDSNVVTMCTSEFGRMIGGNGSGSDHGQGYTSLIMGGKINGGVYGNIIPIATLKKYTELNKYASWPREASQERVIVEIVEKHFKRNGQITFPEPLYGKIPAHTDLNLFRA